MTGELVHLEPWLDKRGLAEFFSASVSWVEKRQQDGMPCAMIAGRVKFRASECESWLAERGLIERMGDAA